MTNASVLAAADAIVEAFGNHDTARYFSLFSADATFIFYTAPNRLNSRAEYEGLWANWEQHSGFRVLGCQSTERHVQLFGNVAIFTHSVESRVEFDGSIDVLQERETIVFEHLDGTWIAVHEHLSPVSVEAPGAD